MLSPVILRIAAAFGLLGFAGCLGVHAATFTLYADRVLHIGVGIAFVVAAMLSMSPMFAGLQAWAERTRKHHAARSVWPIYRAFWAGLDGWQRHTLVVVLAYSLTSFGMGLVVMLDGVASPRALVRMFSGYGLFFFLASGLIARRLAVLSASDTEA